MIWPAMLHRAFTSWRVSVVDFAENPHPPAHGYARPHGIAERRWRGVLDSYGRQHRQPLLRSLAHGAAARDLSGGFAWVCLVQLQNCSAGRTPVCGAGPAKPAMAGTGEYALGGVPQIGG